MEGILWVFLTFMEVFPIPPLSRGRSGGGWGIYVAVVLGVNHYSFHSCDEKRHYPNLPEQSNPLIIF
jgi:hypothetical protein